MNTPNDIKRGNMALALSAVGVGAAGKIETFVVYRGKCKEINFNRIGYVLYRYASKPSVTPATSIADAGRTKPSAYTMAVEVMKAEII